MSYVRWGTVLNGNLSVGDMLFLLKNGVSYRRFKEINGRNKQKSKWYIFWNVASGETKEEQVLSCWLDGAENLGSIDYEQAIAMLETYDPSPLGYGEDICQVNVLFDCIQDWIEDVDNDFKET